LEQGIEDMDLHEDDWDFLMNVWRRVRSPSGNNSATGLCKVRLLMIPKMCHLSKKRDLRILRTKYAHGSRDHNRLSGPVLRQLRVLVG
jgi:hypothetical protein